MANSCFKDSAGLINLSEIKKVSKGRKAMMSRQKASAIEARVRAAIRAQLRNWNRPIPVQTPSAISVEGTILTSRKARVCV